LSAAAGGYGEPAKAIEILWAVAVLGLADNAVRPDAGQSSAPGLPVGRLFCVLRGQTRGLPCGPAGIRADAFDVKNQQSA
jgi:hypothetical protein